MRDPLHDVKARLVPVCVAVCVTVAVAVCLGIGRAGYCRQPRTYEVTAFRIASTAVFKQAAIVYRRILVFAVFAVERAIGRSRRAPRSLAAKAQSPGCGVQRNGRAR